MTYSISPGLHLPVKGVFSMLQVNLGKIIKRKVFYKWEAEDLQGGKGFRFCFMEVSHFLRYVSLLNKGQCFFLS